MPFLLRWWWLLILGPIAAALPAAYLAGQSELSYKSTAIVLVGSPASLEASERLTNTYSNLVKLRSVMTTVKNDLRLSLTEEQLQDKITVSTDASSQLIHISAEDPDPQRASAIANNTASAFIQRINEQLSNPSTVVPDPASSPSAGIPILRVVEAAAPADEPSGSNLVINAGLAAALGLLIAASIGVGLDSIGGDVRVRAEHSVVGTQRR